MLGRLVMYGYTGLKSWGTVLFMLVTGAGLYLQMKITYNGEVFESDVDFRNFRKYAYANRIGYESFEEGHWITAQGEKSITQVKAELR